MTQPVRDGDSYHFGAGTNRREAAVSEQTRDEGKLHVETDVATHYYSQNGVDETTACGLSPWAAGPGGRTPCLTQNTRLVTCILCVERLNEGAKR